MLSISKQLSLISMYIDIYIYDIAIIKYPYIVYYR